MAREYSPKQVELAVNTIKTLSIDGVEKANSGHPGAPMGLANIAFELMTRYLRYDPKDPSWIGRDRFVLSAGHASMLIYSMLHLAGYDLSMSDLQDFRQWGSKTPGHPEHMHTPGVETTTGPLGQGVGNAIGFALAAKLKAARFGKAFDAIRTFAICSDGDVMEGVSAEASSLAGHLGLGNLVVIYDDNKITIEGETDLAFGEDVGKRYESYGWFVQRVDGHDHAQIRSAIDKAVAQTEKPSFIVARTHIANGAPNAHDTAESHGSPLGKDEIALVKKGMGWDPDKHFFVPEEVYALFRDRAADNAKDRQAWEGELTAWRKAHADLAAHLDAFEARHVPDDLFEQLLKVLPEKEDATRSLSNIIQQVVAEKVPSLIGGSADLAPSTKTLIKKSGSVGTKSFEGRNLHFGIREHGMGAICNGLALSGGVIPYGATFLIFSDYMRPSIRLSALGELQCLWIFTHDSVFLGEDGPTHQPIEQLWTLRQIPNHAVVRPADALETAAAWSIALSRKKAPTTFALTRQKVPTVKRDEGWDPKTVLRGAYVAQEATGGKPDVVIIATGSEVQLAIGARERLEKAGKKVRVVSAPCLEVFEQQDVAYRNAVIPPGSRRVSIEAGITLPWRRWIGDDGLAIGIDHFGASAPDKVLAQKFGMTVDSVTERIQSWLG
ncbi:MAG: transketolase [Myxococcales bacterium 68-20]|nr:transketolase [Myxococcales bacterium]OJY26347.1 MAG: transketolase [Myxococcales bacterium 68-20]